MSLRIILLEWVRNPVSALHSSRFRPALMRRREMARTVERHISARIVRIMGAMDAAAAAPTINSRRPRRILRYAWLLLFVLPIAVSTAIYAASTRPDRYYEARWSSTGLLPPAASDSEPRVLVFSARTGSWRSI